MNKTIFIAAILAVATVLTAGLTVLPGSVQEAQANPCANEVQQQHTLDGAGGSSSPSDITTNDDDRDCTFIGNLEDAFEEETAP